MVENDNLKPSFGPQNFAAHDLEDRSDGGDVLVAGAPGRGTLRVGFEPAWEIDLARLIIDQEAGHWVMNLIEEKALEGESNRYVIRRAS